MSHNLPVELLQRVFMLLSPCTDLLTILNVCQRWRQVGQSVIKIRENMCMSAFKLKSPLVWVAPKVNREINHKRFSVPSKRFCAAAVMYEQSVYVFGGATTESTTFNDLWSYDLCTSAWKRVIGKGELPTPRAMAKGGKIGKKLYFYGGFQISRLSGPESASRMDWLNGLDSFEPDTAFWARITLHEANSPTPEFPPIVAAQSGCFLPCGGVNEPSLLILFGGISYPYGSCSNDLYILSPEQGRWVSFPGVRENDIVSWPSGRCGHSTCALDSSRMLLLFGNSESPFPSPSDHSTGQVSSDNVDGNNSTSNQSVNNARPYLGVPTGDLWILTRCQLQPGQDWTTADWYWTKVYVSNSLLSCSPPIDFYHTVSISLPYDDIHEQSQYAGDDDVKIDPVDSSISANQLAANSKVYNVTVISQSNQSLLEEATRQRKHWQRTRLSSELISNSKSLNSGRVDVKERESHPTPHDNICAVSKPLQMCEQATLSGSSYRMNNRRARQLEALAVQERRLFGDHTDCTRADNSTREPIMPNSLPSNHFHSCSSIGTSVSSLPPTRPLGLYSLQITVSPHQSENTDQVNSQLTSQQFNPEPTNYTASADWVAPLRPNLIDFVNGPQECLAFSCTFGYGCVFLFGGLMETDDTNNKHANEHVQSFQDANHSSSGNLLSPKSIEFNRWNSELQSVNAQFYALCPRSLLGSLL